MSEPLNRSTFPRAPEEVLPSTVETVELEQEQTLEAWANAHPHETVALQMVYDHRAIPARYCPSCRELRTLRDEIPFRIAFGERPVLKLMYAAVIQAAERWRGIAVGEFEQRQVRAIREELSRAHTERVAPAVAAKATTSIRTLRADR